MLNTALSTFETPATHVCRSGRRNMEREEFVKMAREAVAGFNRPSVMCEATFTEPFGATRTLRIECERSVRNPASYDPPEWVLDAMRLAYKRGRSDSRADGGPGALLEAQ